MIFGMGRVGLGAYERLKARGMRVVGLDSDPGEVERHLTAGRRVVYGDAEDPNLWHRLRLEGLSAVLLAVPDLEAKAVCDHRDPPRRISGALERDQRLPRGSRRAPRLRVYDHLQLLRAGRRRVRGRGLDGVEEGGRDAETQGTGGMSPRRQVERCAQGISGRQVTLLVLEGHDTSAPGRRR